MSKSWNIRESYYDKNSGVSMCHVDTHIGDFQATVKVHEDDKDIENSFDGQRFAELKCRIQYDKKKKLMYRERANGVRNAYNALLQVYDKSEPFMVKLERQVKTAERDAEHAAQVVKFGKNYKKYIEESLNLRRKMREKAEKD